MILFNHLTMYKLFFLLTSLLWIVPIIRAEDPARIPDARSLSMGGCAITQLYIFNPAVLSFSERYEVSVVYQTKYRMKEMSAWRVAFQCPLQVLDMGFSLSSFGRSEYKDHLLVCGVSKKIDSRWIAGMSLACHMLQIKEMQENIFSPTLDAGMIYLLSEYVKLGFSCQNIPLTNGFLKKERYSVRAGLAWEPKPMLLVMMEAENNSDVLVAGRLGVEYGLFSSFHIRTGLHTNPVVPSVGMGYMYGICVLDVAVAYHHVLGVSPNVTLKFRF